MAKDKKIHNLSLNILKKYMNVRYRLTPLGLLFPASIKNDTEQICITSRELNDVKKSVINSKIYGLLGMKWEEMVGKKLKDNLYQLMQRLKNRKKEIIVDIFVSHLQH